MNTCSRLKGASALAIVLALAPAGQNAAAATLEASLNVFTPVEDDIEVEDRITSAGPGDVATVEERYNEADEESINVAIATGALSPTPAQISEAIELDAIIVREWVASGSAEARFDRLATDTFFYSLTDDDGFSYGGTVEAEAVVEDIFTIEGDGILTFTFDVSGSADGQITTSDRFADFQDDGDLRVDFFAEFDKIGALGEARVSREIDAGESFGSLNFAESFDEELVLSIEVSDGDVIDYLARAFSLVDFDSDFDIIRARGRGDFGSTAELVSVFASDGVSFTSESGFDYLSVNEVSQPETGVIPLPAGAWLLASGLFGLCVAASGRRAG